MTMEYIKDRCQVCGTDTKVVVSSNKLAKQMCAQCIVESIDVDSAADVRDLSMTLRIPFSLKEYYTVKLSERNSVNAMDQYLEYLSNQPEELDSGVFEWHEIDKHYDATLTYTNALAQIQPLREAITERGQEKWGYETTFNEIIRLEQIYESTVKQYNITSSLQQDAVKKAARLSVSMDNLISAGEYKSLRDATAAQAQFLKTANIEDLVAASDDETIRTVADLASYLEKNGFEFNRMLPTVDPDDIDDLMDNYIKNVKEVVYNATGIESQFKDFIENIKKENEMTEADEEATQMPLDDFEVDDFLEAEELRLDRELETEEYEVDFDDENLYY